VDAAERGTNLAAHLIGQNGTIVWLGADGRIAADGRTHHHKTASVAARAAVALLTGKIL
jgi:hypothetical protein